MNKYQIKVNGKVEKTCTHIEQAHTWCRINGYVKTGKTVYIDECVEIVPPKPPPVWKMKDK